MQTLRWVWGWLVVLSREWSVLGAMLKPANHILMLVSVQAGSQVTLLTSLPMIAVSEPMGAAVMQDLAVALHWHRPGTLVASSL